VYKTPHRGLKIKMARAQPRNFYTHKTPKFPPPKRVRGFKKKETQIGGFKNPC